MKYSREVGTDIAMIGLWDPEHDRPDLHSCNQSVLDSSLRQDALEGRLFFVNTGSDGGCPVDFYVDEDVPEDRLRFYKSIGRSFLVVSKSGHLLAGGVEGYISERKQITSPGDRFAVPPGPYALRLHELNEADLHDPKALAEAIGAGDYEYYESRMGGFPWGCVLFLGALLGLAALYVTAHLAYSPILFAPLLLRYLLLWLGRSRDRRFLEVSRKISEFTSSFSIFIFTLSSGAPVDKIQGGWHNLH